MIENTPPQHNSSEESEKRMNFLPPYISGEKPDQALPFFASNVPGSTETSQIQEPRLEIPDQPKKAISAPLADVMNGNPTAARFDAAKPVGGALMEGHHFSDTQRKFITRISELRAAVLSKLQDRTGSSSSDQNIPDNEVMK